MPAIDSASQSRRLIRSRAISSSLVVIAVAAPLFLLVGFGIASLSESENKLLILAGTTAFSLVVIAVSIALRRYADSRQKTLQRTVNLDFSKPSPDWSTAEIKTWKSAMEEARRRLAVAADWDAVLKRHPVSLASFVADKSGGKNWLDVNAIEVMIATEEVSRRCRRLIRNRVPFAEKLEISSIVKAHALYQSKATKWVLDAYPWVAAGYQTVTNPFGLALNAIFGEYLDRAKTQLSDDVQFKLKLMVLQECVATFIDLYGGRLNYARDEISQSAASRYDDDRIAPEAEPIRIVLVGQVSSGKSSLVNEMCNALVAETDLLPATDKRVVYEAQLSKDFSVRLVDQPGLSSDPETLKFALSECIHADLILHVLRASQSARKLDKEFLDLLSQHFDAPANRTIKKPEVVGALSQIGQLISGNGLGKFGADLTMEQRIFVNEVVEHNRGVLGLEKILPFDLNTKFGVSALLGTVEAELPRARIVQFGRQRRDTVRGSNKLTDHVGRLFVVDKGFR